MFRVTGHPRHGGCGRKSGSSQGVHSGVFELCPVPSHGWYNPASSLKKKPRELEWGETGSSHLKGSGVPASRDAQFWGRAAQTDRVQTDASHDGPEPPDHAQMLGGVWLWPQLTKLFGNVAVYAGNENR